jgi:hypothetical protein
MEANKETMQEEIQDQKWYNNRAKVIFSLQAFPPLGIYALLRSTAFTPIQKWLVVLGVSALIGIIIYTGIGAKMNQFVFGLFKLSSPISALDFPVSSLYITEFPGSSLPTRQDFLGTFLEGEGGAETETVV